MRFLKLSTSLCKFLRGESCFKNLLGNLFSLLTFHNLTKVSTASRHLHQIFLTSTNLPLPPPQLTPRLFLALALSLSPLRCTLSYLAYTFPLSVLSPPPHLILPPSPCLISASLPPHSRLTLPLPPRLILPLPPRLEFCPPPCQAWPPI